MVANHDAAVAEIRALELEKSDLSENTKDRAVFEKIGRELEFAKLQKSRAEAELKKQIKRFVDKQLADMPKKQKAFNQLQRSFLFDAARSLQTAISNFSIGPEFTLVRDLLIKARAVLKKEAELTRVQIEAINEGFAAGTEINADGFLKEKQNFNQLLMLQRIPSNRSHYELRLFSRLLKNDFSGLEEETL